ncbi:helix-turn-helix domain-containing protein [Lawsonibacter sp. LCP25S3_G6]|uniref:helix-turn-helix domain-containing protein n=1 Tax=unclassified Lawsonibacter TaxID=2617946 RepID=UPI003F953E02
MSYFQSIYAEERLPHRCKTVYIYLKDRSAVSGSCWPGVKTIARDLGLSRSTVRRALKELERSGWVQRQARYRENGSRTSNLYILLK